MAKHVADKHSKSPKKKKSSKITNFKSPSATTPATASPAVRTPSQRPVAGHKTSPRKTPEKKKFKRDESKVEQVPLNKKIQPLNLSSPKRNDSRKEKVDVTSPELSKKKALDVSELAKRFGLRELVLKLKKLTDSEIREACSRSEAHVPCHLCTPSTSSRKGNVRHFTERGLKVHIKLRHERFDKNVVVDEAGPSGVNQNAKREEIEEPSETVDAPREEVKKKRRKKVVIFILKSSQPRLEHIDYRFDAEK